MTTTMMKTVSFILGGRNVPLFFSSLQIPSHPFDLLFFIFVPQQKMTNKQEIELLYVCNRFAQCVRPCFVYILSNSTF